MVKDSKAESLEAKGLYHRAAKETQERMGIAQSKGEAFRNQNRFYFPK